MKAKQHDRDKIIYDIGIGVFFVLLTAFVIVRVRDVPVLPYMMPCLLHRLTGYYCPGCGGTRAVLYLLHGRWWRSFYYYPLVPITFVWYLLFMVTYTLERATRGRIKALVRYHDGWLWFALIVVAANCAVKNLVLFFTGTAIIE